MPSAFLIISILLSDLSGTVADFNMKGKNVAVIGAGSSGIQIVPALLPEVKAMDHYVRGRTWIAASFGSEFVRERNNGNDGNFDYTEAEKRAWKEDLALYKKYRKTLEAGVQGVYPAVMKDSELQAAMRSQFDQDMRERLKVKPELAERIVPDFAPFCKRLTPGPGYLEALVSPKVNVIHDAIASVDETGIITEDGQHRPVDAIVCATGFRSFGGSFPLYGRGGLSLAEYNKDRPETYLAVCMDRFPNYFQTLGPNSGLGAGNLLMVLESVTLYVAQILRKLATGNVKTIEPKRKQVENFTSFCEAYHKRTVFSDKCASWYKSGTTVEERTAGSVIGVWPGSGVHLIKAYRDVRWEDFEMQPSDGNEFGWFGNGWSVGDLKKDREALTWYLNDTKFVHEDLPESKDG
jgi:cation diffusion facilitator CzcD-associated flavoprotein CzcO